MRTRIPLSLPCAPDKLTRTATDLKGARRCQAEHQGRSAVAGPPTWGKPAPGAGSLAGYLHSVVDRYCVSSGRRDIVACDLPGHGGSRLAAEGFDVAELADAVVDLVDSIAPGAVFHYAGVPLAVPPACSWVLFKCLFVALSTLHPDGL